MEKIKRQPQRRRGKGKRKKQGAENRVLLIVDESSRPEEDADERKLQKTEQKDETQKDELKLIEDLEEERRSREPERDQNNNNKQEEAREFTESHKWALTQVSQMEKIEMEMGGRGEAPLPILQDEVQRKIIQIPPAIEDQKQKDEGLLQEKEKVSTLRPSLFPNMPLYLNFVPANSLPDIKIRSLSEGLKNMRWTVVAPKGKIPASDITQKEGWAIQGDIYLLHITYYSPCQIVQGTMASTYPG